jgi:transcriptional regulator with XRE-family HTH domain
MHICYAMRPSPLRHPVAVLRDRIGLGQKELAQLVKKSIATIQAIELGKLRLSGDLAMKISVETGVDARWLLRGDPAAPPPPDMMIAQEYLSGRPDKDYSKEVFERVRAAREDKQSPIREGEHTREEQIICLLFRLACFYSSARANGEEVMALYRLHNLEGDLAEEFGLLPDEQALKLASKAGRCLQELTTRLKRDQKRLSDLSFAPGKVDPVNDERPVKFLQFRHITAKAMRAINEPRKSDSKAKRKKVPSKKGIEAQISATHPTAAAH